MRVENGQYEENLINEFKTMKYTCVDYRSEMKLLGLKRRLEDENLSEDEKTRILEEIEELEEEMKMG